MFGRKVNPTQRMLDLEHIKNSAEIKARVLISIYRRYGVMPNLVEAI